MFLNSPILRWRRQKQYYNLTAIKCLKCNTVYYPTKYICSCGNCQFDTVQLSGFGTILSFTQITIPPVHLAHTAPYCIGLIQLDEGPKIISQIVDIDFENLKIGIKVKSCFRKYYSTDNKSIINYGIKFILA